MSSEEYGYDIPASDSWTSAGDVLRASWFAPVFCIIVLFICFIIIFFGGAAQTSHFVETRAEIEARQASNANIIKEKADKKKRKEDRSKRQYVSDDKEV